MGCLTAMVPPSLRILHAIHDFLPRHRAGSELYASHLCRAQLARGHHVTLICAEFDPGRPHGDVAWRVHDGLTVVEIVNNWVAPTFEDTYRSPLISARLDAVLQAVQPDVVHVHNLLNLSFDLPRLARARGARCVATLHDYTLVCASGGQRIHRADAHVCRTIDTTRCVRCYAESPFAAQAAWARVARGGAVGAVLTAAGRVARAVAPRAAASAAASLPRTDVTRADLDARLAAARAVFDAFDLFVAPSASIAAEFEALGLAPSRVEVSDYGFPVRDAHAGERRRSGDGTLRIGFAGTLVWHKGVHVLLDALRRLPAEGWELEVHGDPSVFPDYAADLRVRAAGLPVRFAGGYTSEHGPSVFSRFDVLVVPSIWLENSPLVIHEAQMAGVPVIGSRIGGIPNLVRDEHDGLLFTAGDAADLARALQRVLDDRPLLARLAAQQPAVKSIHADADEWDARYAALLTPASVAGASRFPA